MTTKIELIESANGNELGGSRQSSRFFELRGFANRKPGQSNVGTCMLWSALQNAREAAGLAKFDDNTPIR